MVIQAPALVQRNEDGKAPRLAIESIPVAQPGSHELLVKISHVAQNPTDVQAFDLNAFGDGTVLGCDFTGRVESVGDDATRAKKGDVIAGLVWGGEQVHLGAYSHYTLADERISFKVPESISAAQAATVPLACATSWLALFSKDCLHIDRTRGKDVTVLIWGGSSSVGLYAIQIAAYYGFNVVATSSPKNFDFVRSVGASHVFDHGDAKVVADIKKVAPNLEYVFDTIGKPNSSTLASQAIKETGGVLCTVRPGKANTENVTKQTKVTDVLVWTAFLKDHQYKEFHWPASKDDHELAAELFENLPVWLEKGVIKPNVPKVLKGLEAIPEGFQEHRDGKISGYKIVYEIDS